MPSYARQNKRKSPSFSVRKAVCNAAYAYQRHRKARQIRECMRKTHRNCVSALRELTTCHLENRKHVVVRAKMKYEKAMYMHNRCANIITQCSIKYHTENDRKWMKKSIQMLAGFSLALDYVKCIVYDRLDPVERAYYACKGIKFMKLYVGML